MNIPSFFSSKAKKNKTIRDVAVTAVHDMVEKYSEWYDEQGLYLPPDYAADPTSWTEALHKVKRAFCLLHSEMNGEGELWRAKNDWSKFNEQDTEAIKDLEKEIKEGLTIFGSQLLYFTDVIKKEDRSH